MANQKSVKDVLKFKRKKKRPCPLTVDQICVMDHNQPEKLKRFISERGKILPRRNTGVCAKKQRIIVKVIKRARQMGFLTSQDDR